MLKENWKIVSRLELLADFSAVCFSFLAAYHGRGLTRSLSERFGWGIHFESGPLAPISDYYGALLVGLAAYGLFLSLLGAYSSMRLSSAGRIFKISLISSALVFIVLSAGLFLFKLDLSRGVVILFCSLSAALITLERLGVLAFLRYWRARGRNFRTVVIAGTGEGARALAKEISARPEVGVEIIAFVELSPSADQATARLEALQSWQASAGICRSTPAILGVLELESLILRKVVDEVIFADVSDVLPEAQSIIGVCAEQGIKTTLVADIFSFGVFNSKLSYFAGLPLIHIQSRPQERWGLWLKRVIDVVLAGALIVLLSPLLLLIALIVKLDSPGPAIFKQTRVGLNGRLFKLYKFRSMRVGASKELAGLRERNEMSGPVFKLSDDPRITRVGKLLRRTSLDELPQLWNVLMGDMSLVGPRPPVPGEVKLYERKDRRRLSMRPGITCSWQVSGRSDIKDFESWVRLDLEYIDNWSLLGDFGLMIRTIPAVILGRGAR